MRDIIVDSLVEELEESEFFEKVYKNIVPAWSQIRTFPAAAVIYESEVKEAGSSSSNSCYYIGTVLIYVYNKQPKEQFEDILTNLINEVYKIIQENSVLCNDVIDASVAEMRRDGGVVHPYAIAEIRLTVKYKMVL